MPKSKLREQLNLSDAVEDYLKAIYQLREELRHEGDSQARVTTNAIAARLNVAAGSVTGMLKKLAEHDLVSHTPYYGVDLTPTGEHLALELVRHHRLIELYLTHVVGFSWDEVHEQADALEHAISEEFEDRIDAILGCPTSDPHGDPIPTKDGQLVLPAAQSLAAIAPDPQQQWQIVRVLTQDSARLRYLAALGLVPGATIVLLGQEPFGGPARLSTVAGAHAAQSECQIGPEIASLLWVTPAGAMTPHENTEQ